MHLDSIFLMYMRVPFQTFLRFVDILLLIISNLPCTGTRDLVIECDPSKQYSRLNLSFFTATPKIDHTRAKKRKKSKFNYFKRTQENYVSQLEKKNREKSKIETKRS